MKRYLGLTEEEIRENEELWDEERGDPEAPEPTGTNLRSVGVTPADMQTDIQTGQDMNALDTGEEIGPPPGGAGTITPGQQPAAAVGSPTA